jgi:hypothetical protein
MFTVSLHPLDSILPVLITEPQDGGTVTNDRSSHSQFRLYAESSPSHQCASVMPYAARSSMYVSISGIQPVNMSARRCSLSEVDDTNERRHFESRRKGDKQTTKRIDLRQVMFRSVRERVQFLFR